MPCGLQPHAVAAWLAFYEMEPAGGIEPPSATYQVAILPLNDTDSNMAIPAGAAPASRPGQGRILAGGTRDRVLDLLPIRLSTPSGVLRHSACESTCTTRHAVHLQP